MTILAALAGAAIASAAPQPSFDCARSTHRAERIVCGDAQLARMDRYIGSRYAEELVYWRAHNRNNWRVSRSLQRAMIASRDRCTDRACVAETYRQILHNWSGGPRDRFYKRDDELGYLHVEELGDGWVVIDVFAYDRPSTEPGSTIDSATTLIPISNGHAEDLTAGDCGFRIEHAGDGWQITRSSSERFPGCGLFGSTVTFAGHYSPRPYSRKDGGPDR